MTLTAAEVSLCNESLDRIGAGIFTVANQATSVTGLACARHYEKTRDSLLRSYEWPWASTRTTLSQIYTMTLNSSPTDEWAIGDTITGITSGATAIILTPTSPSEYQIYYVDGEFEYGETITNATVEKVLYQGVQVVYGTEEVVWYDTSTTSQVVCDSTTPIVATITPQYKWSYKYQLPEDFLRLREVYEDESTDEADERYEIEGKTILTDYDTLNIKYVKKVTDPDEFEPLFRETLVLRLAMKVIPTLAGTKSPELVADIRDELFRTEGRARCIAAQETNTTGRQDFNLARYDS
jgi:hypothetical protein